MVLEKEPGPQPAPSNSPTSGGKRRRVPSDTAAEMSQVTDHHDVESVNKAKKMKMDGRKTMVREIKSQVVSI